MKPESPFGMVLLIYNALPAGEKPADPTTPEGVRRNAGELEETLIEHWDEMAVQDSTIPLLLISFPDFEEVITTGLATSIARKYPSDLLHHIEVPRLNITKANAREKLFQLVAVRKQIVKWLGAHAFKLVMIKPFTNHGAILERPALETLAKEQPPAMKGLFAGPKNKDLRPVAVEVVPFDGKDGSILGMYNAAGESRPAFMTSKSWHGQNYQPRDGDYRATGTLYFNLPMTRYCLQTSNKDGLTGLDQWSTEPLLSVTGSGWKAQPEIFEDALANLAMLLKIRPITCEVERGERGYRNSPS